MAALSKLRSAAAVLVLSLVVLSLVVVSLVVQVTLAGAAAAAGAASSTPSGATPSPTPTSGVTTVQHHHLTPLSLIVLAGLVLGMLLLTRSIRGRRE